MHKCMKRPRIIFCLWIILVSYSKGHVHYRLYREVVDFFLMVVWLVKTKQKRNIRWQIQPPARSGPIWINCESSFMSQKQKLTCYRSWQPTSKHMKLYIEWNGDTKQRNAIFQKYLSISNLLLFKSFIADFGTKKIFTNFNYKISEVNFGLFPGGLLDLQILLSVLSPS